jgi:hypothetical protein
MISSVHGEASFHLSTPELDLDVTRRGGHMAPVVFHLPTGDVSPYALAPWWPAEYPEIPPLLSVLRGDFFCLPFGGQATGPPHGDPANAEWMEISRGEDSLRLVMDATDSGARIRKTIATRPGHHALYLEHQISNLEGDFSYGTHPILDFTGLAEGVGRVTVSPFHWASVCPGPFSNPEDGETQALAEGAAISDLSAVPLAAGGSTDLTRYPARQGNDDLVMLCHPPATAQQPFAWSAVVFEEFVWISLKNPADFPSTLLWMSNGGRTAPPWNAKHLARMGIEDVCSYFATGVDRSRLDLLAAHGVPTTRNFRKDLTTTLRTIQAVAAVPRDFGAIRSIVPHTADSVKITTETSKEIEIPLDWQHIV